MLSMSKNNILEWKDKLASEGRKSLAWYKRLGDEWGLKASNFSSFQEISNF